jgi:hypothetical protein
VAEVFVSYAHEDRDAARAIIAALAGRGLSVVLEDSEAAQFIEPRVQGQTESARCVILLWSERAARAATMQTAIQHAVRAWSDGRLLLATLDDAELPVGLRDLQAIPVRPGPAGLDPSALLAGVDSMIASAGLEQVLQASEDRDQPVPPAEGVDFSLSRDAIPPPPAPRQPAKSAGRSLAPVYIGIAFLVLLLIGGQYFMSFRSSPRVGEPPPISDPLPPPRPKPAPPPASKVPPSPAPLPSPPPAPKGRPVPAPEPPEAKVPPPPRPQTPEEMASPSDPWWTSPKGLAFLLAMLALGVAIGAGSVWLWARSQRKRAQGAGPVPHGAPAPQYLAANPAHQVFVSYSRQDGSAVEELVRHIEQTGYTVWIDRHATGSQRYAAPIVRAIRTSQLVALMCSRNAFSSDHVIREVYVAGDCKKPFIAFQLEDAEFPDEVLYFVSGFPRVPTGSLNVQQLRSEIARLVAAEPQGTA